MQRNGTAGGCNCLLLHYFMNRGEFAVLECWHQKNANSRLQAVFELLIDAGWSAFLHENDELDGKLQNCRLKIKQVPSRHSKTGLVRFSNGM